MAEHEKRPYYVVMDYCINGDMYTTYATRTAFKDEAHFNEWQQRMDKNPESLDIRIIAQGVSEEESAKLCEDKEERDALLRQRTHQSILQLVQNFFQKRRTQ